MWDLAFKNMRHVIVICLSIYTFALFSAVKWQFKFNTNEKTASYKALKLPSEESPSGQE